MVEEIKTLDERKNKLLAIGKKQGFVTYEQLADQLKGLEVDSDTLDELYNFLVEADIEIVSEDGTDDASGEEITQDMSFILTSFVNVKFSTDISWVISSPDASSLPSSETISILASTNALYNSSRVSLSTSRPFNWSANCS